MTIAFEVSDELLAFIRQQVEEGGYASISEYVESLIEREMARVSALKPSQDADLFHPV